MVDAALSDEDRKTFASELLKRLKTMPDQHQQMFYFALVSAAIDELGQQRNTESMLKALDVADKAMSMKDSKQLKSSQPMLNRLRRKGF